MKVLLTGASGFVGSHLLDALLNRGHQVRILMRSSSSTGFIEPRLKAVEVCRGDMDDPPSLKAAVREVEAVVHCAGCVKALSDSEFFRINQIGTRNLLEAVLDSAQARPRFVFLSSLAAAGPATSRQPSRESDPPQPVSLYGRSKLAAEREIQAQDRLPWVILRPPGVYGPRDREFLKLFRALQWHLQARVAGGRQELSLVYVEDLAAAVCHCLSHERAVGRIFNVASPEVVTTRALIELAARLLNTWTVPLPLPLPGMWMVCALQEVVSRLKGRPDVLSRRKYPEIAAPGWVADVAALRRETGFAAATRLEPGLEKTMHWYRREGWL